MPKLIRRDAINYLLRLDLAVKVLEARLKEAKEAAKEATKAGARQARGADGMLKIKDMPGKYKYSEWLEKHEPEILKRLKQDPTAKGEGYQSLEAVWMDGDDKAARQEAAQDLIDAILVQIEDAAEKQAGLTEDEPDDVPQAVTVAEVKPETVQEPKAEQVPQVQGVKHIWA